jgi:hypothetical protein
MRVGETAMASAMAKQRSAPSCKGFAKCRRADIFELEQERSCSSGL